MRVFPEIEAPDAIDRLVGNTVVEAFDRFVFNDPQRIQLQARAAAKGGEALAVGFECRLLSAVWPIDFGTAPVWASPIGIARGCHSEEAETLCRAADSVLRKRFARLIGYLNSGELAAQGLSQAGTMITIPRSFWQRDQSYLDLYKGDLLERAPDDERELSYRPLFIGLTLVRPEFVDRVFHVKPISADQIPPITIEPTPVQIGNAGASLTSSRTAAEWACTEWLIAMMKGSPDVRQSTVSDLWEQARHKWPSLTERGYHSARKNAVRETGAVAWSAGGAPRKFH